MGSVSLGGGAYGLVWSYSWDVNLTVLWLPLTVFLQPH